MRDVAATAGVSVATVSRVLNGRQDVDPALAKRVHTAVTTLGYRPNLVARSLRRKASAVLGLVISDIENPFFTSVCRGIEDTARQRGYSLLLCNTDEDADRESEYLQVLADQAVAGVVMTPSQHADTAPLTSKDIPIVALDRVVSRDMDAVYCDSRTGARQATRHLLGSGARRIACITGPKGLTTADDRLAGYREALRDAGRREDPALWQYANYREDGGREAVAAMLTLPDPPDAFFVANNRMLVGALEALFEAGVRIPDEAMVVGFDDLAWASFVRPAVSTVRQPTYEIGAAASRLLIERIDGLDSPPRELVFQPQLVVRQSSVRPYVSER